MRLKEDGREWLCMESILSFYLNLFRTLKRISILTFLLRRLCLCFPNIHFSPQHYRIQCPPPHCHHINRIFKASWCQFSFSIELKSLAIGSWDLLLISDYSRLFFEFTFYYLYHWTYSTNVFHLFNIDLRIPLSYQNPQWINFFNP